MYYIFYKTDDGGSNPMGVHFYQDISSYSLQQGDDIYIEWSLGAPNLNDNQLPSTDSSGNSMTWSGATYPNTKIKVLVYGDDDGTGTAYGTLITHAQMLSSIGGSTVDFFDEQYTFQRTLGSGTGSVTTTDATKFNTIRFVVLSIVDGETFYIDDVDFGFAGTTTPEWTLTGPVVNSSGTLIFQNGGSASQGSNTYTIDPAKQYRVTCQLSTPDGVGPQNAEVNVNGMLANAIDPNQSPPTFIQSGTVTEDVYFPITTNDITIDVSGGIINIHSMTIQAVEPYGGNVDCWDLNGADSDFLYTSQLPYPHQGGSIVFDEAPEDTYLHQNLINTNRVLDFTNGTKCDVAFNVTNYTGSGELTFRLYNDEGEGFEYPISGNGSWWFSGIIGDNTSSTLVSKFGFYVSSTDTFSGEIDNISLVFNGESGGKTISFHENSKGWTSFKSFVPEFGLSCVNQYYTMSLGQLWKHHVEQFDENEFLADGITPNPNYGKEINRNTFYETHEDSSITPILNMQPAVVKNFNTLNYEGSQSKVDQWTSSNSDGEYYNLQEEKGWYVYDIHTDKQEGTLNEFIEKEGKWFNYIKGKPGEIDPAAFNFQGLGIVETID